MAVVWWPLCSYQNWATEQHHLVKFHDKTNTEEWYSFLLRTQTSWLYSILLEVWPVAWKWCGIQSRMREQAAGGWSSTLEKSSSPLQPSKQIKPASWILLGLSRRLTLTLWVWVFHSCAGSGITVAKMYHRYKTNFVLVWQINIIIISARSSLYAMMQR